MQLLPLSTASNSSILELSINLPTYQSCKHFYILAVPFGYPGHTGTLYLSETQYLFTVAYPISVILPPPNENIEVVQVTTLWTKSPSTSNLRNPLDLQLPYGVSPIERKRTSSAQHRTLCMHSVIANQKLYGTAS